MLSLIDPNSGHAGIYLVAGQAIRVEQALNLLGAKMKAAQIFYGDNVGGALIEEENKGDLFQGLVRQALGQVDIGHAEGMFGTGANHTAADSPIGSPIVPSRMLVSLNELWVQRQTIIRPKRRTTQSRSATPSDEVQLGLF